MTILQPPPEKNTDWGAGVGFAIGVGLNLLQAGLVFWIANAFQDNLDRFVLTLMIGWGGAGLIQLIYVVPFYFYLRKKEKSETAKGLTIAASLVILLNVACWGFWTYRS